MRVALEPSFYHNGYMISIASTLHNVVVIHSALAGQPRMHALVACWSGANPYLVAGVPRHFSPKLMWMNSIEPG